MRDSFRGKFSQESRVVFTKAHRLKEYYSTLQEGDLSRHLFSATYACEEV